MLIILITLFSHSLAWWEMGHMITAQIAEYTLQKEDPRAYSQMLTLIEAFKGLTDGKSDSFVESAVWADDIKQQGFNINDNYHFVDRVYAPDGIMIGPSDYQRDINGNTMIDYAKSMLTKHKDISYQRAFMARYLMHIVGDLHQPLHTTNMFDRQHSHGDMGGYSL